MITKPCAEVVSVILVDTSVLIDKLRKIENEKTILFDRLHNTKAPFGISIFTYHEILQGAKSEQEFIKLHNYFSTQKILSLPNTIEAYTESAKLLYLTTPRLNNQKHN